MSATQPAPEKPYGILAEFESPAKLLHAAQTIRKLGYSRTDAFSPFPVHGMDRALGIPVSNVPLIILGGALTGGVGALLLQWWTSAVNYPIKIAGKPYFSLPAFVPVTFELTVLFSAFAAVFGMLFLNKLPCLYHPVFKHSRFRGVTDDKFFLIVEATDPLYDAVKTREDMSEAGGMHIEEVTE